MKMERLRQPALSAMAVLLISGASIAFAADPQSTPAPAPIAPAVEPVTPAEPVEAAGAEPVEAAGADTDTLQEGDQTTPDSPADQAAEKAGTETEAADVAEPGDAGLPGGGHADDPNDANADHQFEGEE